MSFWRGAQAEVEDVVTATLVGVRASCLPSPTAVGKSAPEQAWSVCLSVTQRHRDTALLVLWLGHSFKEHRWLSVWAVSY